MKLQMEHMIRGLGGDGCEHGDTFNTMSRGGGRDSLIALAKFGSFLATDGSLICSMVLLTDYMTQKRIRSDEKLSNI
jgi:hypothetical protein